MASKTRTIKWLYAPFLVNNEEAFSEFFSKRNNKIKNTTFPCDAKQLHKTYVRITQTKSVFVQRYRIVLNHSNIVCFFILDLFCRGKK